MSISSNIRKAHPILWGGLAASIAYLLYNNYSKGSYLTTQKDKDLIDDALHIRRNMVGGAIRYSSGLRASVSNNYA